MNPRNKIYWIGSAPENIVIQEFDCRDLDVDAETLRPVPLESVEAWKKICEGLGAIFVHNPDKLGATLSFLRLATNPQVIYSGVAVSIIVDDLDEIDKIRRTFANSQNEPEFNVENVSLRILTGESIRELARYFSSLELGRVPKFDLIIEADSTLTAVEKTLLQRSFSDCQSIVIQKLSSQGFSARVHLAYPRFNSDLSVSRALPFLVKFDRKEKIESELNYYRIYVDRHLPFNLRPNIDPSRCFFLAGDDGILVANYVDRGVSLLEAVELGSGSSAIHCLFEESLDRWFRNAERRDESPLIALRERFELDKLEKNSNVLREASNIGLTPTPEELLANMASIRCESHKYGISHRDLHARNVLVKGSDAVVIDFSRCDKGPILIDFATLDVSIGFDSVFQNENTSAGKFEKWIEFVRQMYTYKRIERMPEAREGYESFARQWSCIRQIRRYALMEQANDSEFALCIAVELLRRSMFVDDEIVGEKIAAYAYHLCCELVREIQTTITS